MNYRFTLLKIPEDRRTHLHRGGSIKSRKHVVLYIICASKLYKI